MKKLIMLVLLASSLFAVDCSYWLKKTYEDMYQKIAKKEKNKHRILLYKCILILNNK